MITTTDVPEGASRRWPIAYAVLFFSMWQAATFAHFVFFTGSQLSIDPVDPSRFQPLFLVPGGMLLLTAATTVTTWSLLTRRQAGIGYWMIFGGALPFNSFPIALLYFTSTPNELLPMVVTACICALHAVGAGMVLGSVLCAVPLMAPSTLLRYGAYSRLMVVVSAAFCLAPLPPLSVLLALDSYVWWTRWIIISFLGAVVIVQVVLLICSRCLLTEIRPGAEESCPIAAGIATFRRSRPLPPVICLFFAALCAAVAVVHSYYLIDRSFQPHSCSANASHNFIESTMSQFLTPMIISLPTLTTPLIIHHFRDRQRLCKVLEPILCAATGVAFYFTISAATNCYGSYFPILSAFSVCRTFLIGIAYSDLLWQVFSAHNDGAPTPVGSGGISITVSALGAAVGVLSVFLCATSDRSIDNESLVIRMAFWYSIGASGLNFAASVWRAAHVMSANGVGTKEISGSTGECNEVLGEQIALKLR